MKFSNILESYPFKSVVKLEERSQSEYPQTDSLCPLHFNLAYTLSIMTQTPPLRTLYDVHAFTYIRILGHEAYVA